MFKKESEKLKAIHLRKQGKTYGEILRSVEVAKSSISLWLRSVKLSKRQKQRITKKKLLSAFRGGLARRNRRISLTQEIQEKARNQIKSISNRELWLLGTVLYWAEGSKEKEGNWGNGVRFTNSDHTMIRLFLLWLKKICHISKKEICLDLYIHESGKNSLPKVVHFWQKQTGIKLAHIYFKKNKIKIHRNNTGASYFGTLSIKVRSSSKLSRAIAGWIQGITACTIENVVL